MWEVCNNSTLAYGITFCRFVGQFGLKFLVPHVNIQIRDVISMITCRTKNNLPFKSIFLKMLKAVLGGRNHRLPKIYFKELGSEYFHRDSLIMAKYFIFLGILSTLTVLKQEFWKRE